MIPKTLPKFKYQKSVAKIIKEMEKENERTKMGYSIKDRAIYSKA